LIFHLEERITAVEKEDEEEEMVKFMLYEKNITNIIKLCDDLNACGTDRINYQIMKRARADRIEFMQLLVRRCIQSRIIINT
jgi:hypothetical protein